MRNRVWLGCAAATVVLAVLFYAEPFQGSAPPLPGLFPSGALLYLEARDFTRELRDWNGSPEKQQWLQSARYEGFSRSALFQKLEAAWEEFGTVASFVPDAALLESIAGAGSAVAIYDIGELQFLYVTRLPNARAVQTALWQSRAKYETRHAGNYDFFVRTASGRTVAYAAAGDYLVLGTREELVVAALRLLSGEHLASVSEEGYYTEAVAQAAAPGDLRLVLNLEALTATPQFRTYWVQRNTSEVKQYWAGVADLRRTGPEVREERAFLGSVATPPVEAGAGGLMRLVPETAAFSRSRAKPAPGLVLDLIVQKILAPKPGAGRFGISAPQVDMEPVAAGGESDLENRIDQAPLAPQSSIAWDDLRQMLAQSSLNAVLEIQSGRVLPGQVFVATPSVLAIQSNAPWDGAAVRQALSAAMARLWSTGGPTGTQSLEWVERPHGSRRWYESPGLAGVQMATDGNLLLIANSADALVQVLDRLDRAAPASNASLVAVFRYSEARADYRKLMTSLEQGGERPFFSQDLASLAGTLGVGEVQLSARDSGTVLRETVTYKRVRN